MPDPRVVRFSSSLSLTTEEESLLKLTLSGDLDCIADRVPVPVYDFSDPRLRTVSSQSVPGWQYLSGLDLQSILALAFAALPAIFLKQFVEESAKDFWLGLKELLKRVAHRRRGTPLTSIQISFPLETYRDIPIEATITSLNAFYVSGETWLSIILRCMLDMEVQLNAARSYIQAQCALEADINRMKGKRVVVHALIVGTAAPTWQIAVSQR